MKLFYCERHHCAIFCADPAEFCSKRSQRFSTCKGCSFIPILPQEVKVFQKNIHHEELKEAIMLDLSYECALSEDDLLGLGITQEELSALEERGLPYMDTGQSHLYLSSCLRDFLKQCMGT